MSTDMVVTLGVPRSHSRRSRQLLLGCVLGSLTLHWAVLAGLQGFERESYSVPARVLSVVLLRVESPQSAAAAPSAAKHQPDVPKRKQTQSMPKSQAASGPSIPEQRPIPTRSDPRPASEPALAVSAPPPDSGSSAPDSISQVTANAPRAGAQTTPPVFNAGYLRNPPPVYPVLARRNGEQGTVTLKVLVTRDGTPARVSVERTSGSAHLDRAALDTVKTWRFVPAREGTEPVEAWVLVPIVFRLEGAS